MAKTKSRPPRHRRPKQGFIPGTEPPSVPAIDAAADTYYDAMQERCRLSKEEDEAKVNLMDKMKESGFHIYQTPDGLIVRLLDGKTNVKVKRKNDGESNGDGKE